MLTLRTANDNECVTLSDLCMRSKAVWGYDQDFLDACRAELTLTADTLAHSAVQVAEIDGHIVGVAEVTAAGDAAYLEKLFVDPAALRGGTGRQLFEWARRKAASMQAKTLTIESDPQAADFYRCMGAIDDGKVASTLIPGRLIPKLILQL